MASGSPNTQTAHFDFGHGVDERTHPRQLQPPTLIRCENGRLNRNGANSKRPGNTLLVAAGTAPVRLSTYRNELLQVDGTYVRSYSAKTLSLEAKDNAFEAIPSIAATTFTVTSTFQHALGYSATAGVTVMAWIGGSSTIYTTVTDSVTGTELQSSKSVGALATVDTVFVVTIGATVILVYAPGSNNIAARTLSSDGKSWSSATNIVTDANSSPQLAAGTDGTSLYVAYKSSTPSLKVKSFSTALANTATIVGTEAVADTRRYSIVATASERVWVAYQDRSSSPNLIKACAFNLTLVSETVAPVTLFSTPGGASLVYTSVERASPTTAVVAADYDTALGGHAVVAPVVNTSGSVVSTAANRQTFWSRLGSRPFAYGGRVYCWLITGGARWSTASPPTEQDKQYTTTLVDLLATDSTATAAPARPVTWEAPRFTSNPLWGPASVIFRTATAPEAAISVQRSNDGRSGLVLVKADFAHVGLSQPAEIGETLPCAPGCVYDSTTMTELGFCYWPQEATVTTSTAAGSLAGGSTYRWRVVYIRVDSKGQVDRSEPSDYKSVTLGASHNTATLVVPNLSLTTRQDLGNGFYPPVGIEVYRTTANPTDDTAYYLVASTASTSTNDVTLESTAITDGASDATIAANAQIYTQTGAKRRVQPPGFSAVAAYRNRLWGAHLNTIWYSGAIVDGETPWFSDEFVQPLDTTSAITAMWVMDDTLYISTANRLYFLQADGPADNGTQNDIGPPFRVATDWGCTDHRSVVVMPGGTIYQSAVGLQLLTRSRQVVPQVFGLKVQTTLAAYPTIVAALVHPTGGYVMFFCTNGSTSARIIYDYTADEWLVDTSAIFGVFKSATISSSGTLYWLNATGVYYEDTTTYLDAGAWVTRVVEFADFHPTGTQGFMKVTSSQFLAQKYTSHGMTIEFAKDFASPYFDSRSYTDAEIDALSIEQVEVVPKDQRCQAMRVRITDTAPTTGSLDTGQGAELVAMSLDFDPLNNKFQLPAGARK